jgi:diguanylate cyclase (GGDEF)-like protein
MDLRYLKEILDFSFDSMRFSLLGLLLNALLVFWILYSYLPEHWRLYLYIWLGGMVFIVAMRYTLATLYAKEPHRYYLFEWKRIFIIFLVISTLTWSSALLFLLPIDDPIPMIMLGIVYVGVAAGGILGLAGFYIATLFFIGFPLILFALILLYKEEQLAGELTALLSIMLIFAMILAKKMHQKILDIFVANVRYKVEHRIAEQAKNRLRAVIESSPVGIFFFEKNSIIDANSAFYNITGIKKGAKRIPKELAEHIDIFQKSDKFIQLNNKYFKLLISPLTNSKNFSGAVGIIADITKERLLLEKTQYQAKHDHLTDLPNRASLFEHIQKQLETGGPFIVFFVDIDNFKIINDSLGHHVGDTILIEISNRLKKTIRKDDFIARLGGDEFVIVSPCTGDDTKEGEGLIMQMTTAIQKEISKPILIDSFHLSLTASIGAVFVNSSDTNPYEIIKQADIAMYQAKKDGKNKAQVYKHDMERWINWRMEIENAIKIALAKEEFYLVYQPIVSVTTDKTVCIETLLRWNNPKYGKTPIDEVIQIAEESGMIVQLGEWIFHRAMKDFAHLKKEFGLKKIAINVSIKQFIEPSFLAKITTIAQKHGVDFGDIELEITESIFLNDKKRAKEVLLKLKEHGFSIALDDFGTGYSSLSYLKHLPFNALKIDRSFIIDTPGNPDDTALVKTIISIAKNFKLKTVAEGVETREQLEFIRQAGCDLYQGFLKSKPLQLDQLKQLLAQEQ